MVILHYLQFGVHLSGCLYLTIKRIHFLFDRNYIKSIYAYNYTLSLYLQGNGEMAHH